MAGSPAALATDRPAFIHRLLLRRQADQAREGMMDTDLDAMSRDELIAEVRKLRNGIRAHRDSSGQDLCWHHPALWALLPEKTDPVPAVPAWPEFMAGCVNYRKSLDIQLPIVPVVPVPGKSSGKDVG